MFGKHGKVNLCMRGNCYKNFLQQVELQSIQIQERGFYI